MNKLSVQLSSIVKGSVCLLSLIGLGNFMAAPAKADQAAARGAVTIVRPSGSSFSVSGEVTLPAGLYYDGALTVEPTSTGEGTNQEVANLLVTPGTVTSVPADAANPFVTQVTQELVDATEIEDKAAIIKSAVGVNGIGGGATGAMK